MAPAGRVAFDPDYLQSVLTRHAEASRYVVAYSGGVDSHVLLHLLQQLAQSCASFASVAALHINHGIHAHAADWATHCTRVADGLGIAFTCVQVDGVHRPGQSPEEAARIARYTAFSDYLLPGDVLLLAQHQDDQTETVLLQLMRGAGVTGLAGMAPESDLGRGQLLRPLLAVTRDEIVAYAQQQGLEWIDDPSNQDRAVDRNFLRHDVIPLLKSRWPALDRVVGRSARHSAVASGLNQDLAELDYHDVRATGSDTLGTDRLLGLELARRCNLIRFWLSRVHQVRVPDTQILDRVCREVIPCQHDRTPLVQWGEGEIRRFQGHLFFMHRQPRLESGVSLDWDLNTVIDLPAGLGRLSAQHGCGGGHRIRSHTSTHVRVAFRVGGEKLKPVGFDCTRSLKNLFQEHHIPPWWRDRIPLLFVDSKLAAVGDFWIDQRLLVNRNEPGWQIHWKHGNTLENRYFLPSPIR